MSQINENLTRFFKKFDSGNLKLTELDTVMNEILPEYIDILHEKGYLLFSLRNRTEFKG